MPLRKLVLEKYRCFRDRQEVEFAPVTIVLGKNNSGKSVLTRAPLVIATGFDTHTTAPLDLERLGPDTVDSFTDLIFEQNVVRGFSIGVEVDGDRPFALSATVQSDDFRVNSAFVSEFEARTPEDSLSLRMSAAGESSTRRYDVEQNGQHRKTAHVRFHGLVPYPAGLPDPDSWAGANLTLGPIRYLGPYRERPGRQHRLPFGTPGDLGAYGQGVSGILAHDAARNEGRLLDLVNEGLQAIVPGWQVAEIPAGPLWSTVLTRAGSDVRVNVADAGTGLAQVLPLLVQCALDQLRGRAEPALQIIEEPEMHLHPAAHAELADIYLGTAAATGTQFLIETHSETLLLRIRRRLAENKYPPDMVAIYVVEQEDGASTVRRVGLDGLGNLDEDWPEGYFSQDYHEVRALAAAQAKRSRHAS
jgi:hypothetical protein